MTKLHPGDKVKIVKRCYLHDTVGATYYVLKDIMGVAFLTNDKNLTTPVHTSEDDGYFCLCYPSACFEPLPKGKKGFVSFIRSLEPHSISKLEGAN